MKYGVIRTKTITHEGDERSRTHPGHGYPAYSENVRYLEEFDGQDALKKFLKTHHSEKFRVIEFQDIPYESDIVINLKRPGVTRST